MLRITGWRRVLAGLTVLAGGAATVVAAHPGAVLSASAFAPPPIRHVWLVQLENLSFDESVTNNPNHFLSRVLPASGVVLTQYYGTGHFSLDNYISQLSGQAPNPDTQADCRVYQDVQPGVVVPTGMYAGQATGAGCVYPATVLTLADQLVAKGMTWKGYMEDMGNDSGRDNGSAYPGGGTTCAHPSFNTQDGTQTAEAADQYASRHNPFMYFHSIIDNKAMCNADVVPLTALSHDLASEATTPNFSYVTPNLCNDAHDATCAGPTACGGQATGGVGGLVAADCWLQRWIPRIVASPAYRDDGMVIVTFDESDTLGSGPNHIGDATSCCNEMGGPGNPGAPGQDGPGGGHIAMVILSRYVNHGTTTATPYNHYALLRSLEDLYGITTGGSDGMGHLGFAGMAGLQPFGSDVYDNPAGTTTSSLVPTPAAPVIIPGLTTTSVPAPAIPNTAPDSGFGPKLATTLLLVSGAAALGYVRSSRRRRARRTS